MRTECQCYDEIVYAVSSFIITIPNLKCGQYDDEKMLKLLIKSLPKILGIMKNMKF